MTKWQVISISLLESHVLKTKFTDPEFSNFPIFFRIWGKVPRVYFILPKLHFVNIFDL